MPGLGPAPDAALIDEAETLLRRASTMNTLGRYQLEAAVQSAHAVRRLTGAADWAAIEKLYDALLALTGSPVVAINRAVAAAETHGPIAGLAQLDALADDARLADYQPYWAARAGLLARTGDTVAAASAYERAIGLESDPAVRRFLQARRAGLENLMDGHHRTRRNHRAAHSLRSLGAEADLRRHCARHDGLPAAARDGEQRPGRLGRGVLGRLAGDAGGGRALDCAARTRAGRER